MYKIIIIVLLFFVVVSLNSNSSSEEKAAEKANRVTLLGYCEAKFQYREDYYAICPYDKTLKLSYQEYVEFNKPVQAAPEAFVKAESDDNDKSWIVGLIIMGIFLGIFIMIFKFYYTD